MKLLQVTNRNFLISATIVLIVSGIILYIWLTKIIKEETLDALAVNCVRTAKQIEGGAIIKSQTPTLEIKPSSTNFTQGFKINDTLIFDEIENEEILFQEVAYYQNINGNPLVIIFRSKAIENKDVFWAVFKALTLCLLLILVTLILLNRWNHKKIWSPFYKNLEKLKSYNSKTEAETILVDSKIDEFDNLNAILKNLLAQTTQDYLTLKKFTENASHELQTPLSIIRNNSELLMQENVNHDVSMYIEKIHQTNNRISNIIESLLLLSKIENNQFSSREDINFNLIIHKFSELFYEVFDNSIEFVFEEQGVFKWSMNQFLAEILVKNLLENAIKHKSEKGQIFISIENSRFSIKNPSFIPENTNLNEYFTRFEKGNPSSDSPGLGLAIILDICNTSGLKVTADYLNGYFNITIICI